MAKWCNVSGKQLSRAIFIKFPKQFKMINLCACAVFFDGRGRSRKKEEWVKDESLSVLVFLVFDSHDNFMSVLIRFFYFSSSFDCLSSFDKLLRLWLLRVSRFRCYRMWKLHSPFLTFSVYFSRFLVCFLFFYEKKISTQFLLVHPPPLINFSLLLRKTGKSIKLLCFKDFNWNL